MSSLAFFFYIFSPFFWECICLIHSYLIYFKLLILRQNEIVLDFRNWICYWKLITWIVLNLNCVIISIKSLWLILITIFVNLILPLIKINKYKLHKINLHVPTFQLATMLGTILHCYIRCICNEYGDHWLSDSAHAPNQAE